MNTRSRRASARMWLLTVPLLTMAVLWSPAGMANAQSQNIAYIDSLTVVNGGTFPTTDPAFSGFNFYQMTIANITPANIAAGGVCGASGCDTILLNGASTGISCNVSGALSAAQKTTLVDFVDAGGKLIIYDSECPTQDYSWLPYGFTTSNPGAQGAQGTLTIVENNALSSDSSSDPKFIDASVLSSQTDAIGDMNVMTTQDAAWCLDMSGTNVTPVTGPVHTYARYGTGLLIYNGMDVDTLSSSTTPNSTSGSGNLAKIWLQELQVPFNPAPVSDLPCGATVVGITLAEASATIDLTSGQTQYTATAKVEDLLGNPQQNVAVAFSVLSGPNTGASGVCTSSASCLTDANGEVSFTYTSNGTLGTDEFQACYVDTGGQTQCSQTSTITWIRSTPPTPPGQNVELNGSGGAGAFGPLTLFAGLLGLWLLRRRRGSQAESIKGRQQS